MAEGPYAHVLLLQYVVYELLFVGLHLVRLEQVVHQLSDRVLLGGALEVDHDVLLTDEVEEPRSVTPGFTYAVERPTGRRGADELVDGQVQGCRYEISREDLTASLVKNGPLSDRQLELLAHQISRLHWTMGDGDTAYDTEGVFDGDDLYDACIKRNVAFVPGKYFYFDESLGISTMRFNFTMVQADVIDKAVKIVADTAQELLIAEA